MTTGPRHRIDRARSAARRALAWVVWSPQRAFMTAAAIAGLLSVAFVITTTTTLVDVNGALKNAKAAPAATSTGPIPPGLPQSPRNAWPGDKPPTATASTTGSPTVKMAGGAEDTTRRFVELWLEGAGKGPAEHAAWAEKLAPYTNPAMLATLDRVELSAIEAATISSVGTTRIGDLVTSTVTLSTGRIFTVQSMRNGDEWRISGAYLSPK